MNTEHTTDNNTSPGEEEMIDVHHDPHLFTEHTSPKLTFFGGIVMGITAMTLTGVAFFAYVLNGGSVGQYQVTPLQSTIELLEEPIQEVSVTGKDSIALAETTNIIGSNDDFEVTLVQYVDYECLFCKKFFPEVVQFTEDNSDTVRLLVKHDPLVRQHPNAKSAAIAAECAGEQGKFLPYSLYLFENQADLSETLLTSAAEAVELDITVYNQCLENTAIVERIERHSVEADNLGIASQPNLVVWYNDNRIELIDGYVAPSYLESLLGQ